MKSKLMIIAEDYCRFFVLKQILESEFRLSVTTVGVHDLDELASEITNSRPDHIFFRSEGGVAGVVRMLRRKKVNRLNSEAILIASPRLASEVDIEIDRDHETANQSFTHYDSAAA